METLPLNGTWQLFWHDGERGFKADLYSLPHCPQHRAIPAAVPGGVHSALLACGLIEEPANGLAVLRCRWVEENFWIFRRTFSLTAANPAERVWLEAGSVDLAASVWINGREVGTHANFNLPLRLDVTDFVVAGENVIAISVEAGLYHTRDKPAGGYGGTEGARLLKRAWLRKPQSSFGWDWAPRLLNVGLFGDVRLVRSASPRLIDLWACSSLAADHTSGSIAVRAALSADAASPEPVVLIARLPERGVEIRSVRTVAAAGDHDVHATVDVPAPELWWPVGHGSPRLYTLDLELRHGDVVLARESRRLGFRRIRFDEAPHPVRGRHCILEINGRRIFAKGGNFVPNDLLVDRLTPGRYRRCVELALESNFNLLRVWGGGLYESSAFYELCDEHGILVWQEFVFACSKYPLHDEAFYRSVRAEAVHQIRRLAHHASLVVWCGNNELEIAAYSWGYDKGVVHPDYALFHFVLPRLLRESDGTRPYRPSSPYSPVDDASNPNDDHSGDQHPWSIGFADTDFRKYRAMECRFPNEGGILGPTALPTVRACLPRGQEHHGSLAWDLHDNSVNFWFGPNQPPECCDAILDLHLGLEARSLALEDYVFTGGLLQGEGLADYIRNFRRRMFDSAAAIFWMYNDVWPAVRSWTTVDHALRRTPSFHPVRRAFAPAVAVVVREGDEVRIHGINDSPVPVSGRLEYGLVALSGAWPRRTEVEVTLPANASTVLASFPAAEWDRAGVRTHAAYAVLAIAGADPVLDRLFLPLFKEIAWPRAEVTVAREPGAVVLTCAVFAWRVCLDLDGETALPDNFFDLLPGRPRRLAWADDLPEPRVLRVGNGLFSA